MRLDGLDEVSLYRAYLREPAESKATSSGGT